MFTTFLSNQPTQANISELATNMVESLTIPNAEGQEPENPCVAYAKVVSLGKSCEIALTNLKEVANQYCEANQLGMDGKDFPVCGLIFRRTVKTIYNWAANDDSHTFVSLKKEIDEITERKKVLNQKLEALKKEIENNHKQMKPIDRKVIISFQKVA